MKTTYHLVPCTGAAHSNGHIDNCNLCAPFWGQILLPSAFDNLTAWRAVSEETRQKYAKGLRAETKRRVQRN